MGMNTIQLIDTGRIQQMQDVPVTVAAGACSTGCAMVAQGNPYIYHLLAAVGFYRYNVLTDSWQQLASPTGTVSFVAGCSMAYDPNVGTMGGVWLFTPKATASWCIFQVYDIATNAWTDKAVPTGLASAWGTASTLLVTPTQAHASGDNNVIYLAGNNATTWYKYDKTENTWAVMGAPTALPAAAGAACKLIWEYGVNPDKILYIRGTGTSAMYEYTISTDTFGSLLDYQPNTETLSSGTSYAYGGANRVFFQKDATKRCYSLNLTDLRLRPFGTLPGAVATAREGDKMAYVTDGNSEWVYVSNNSLSQYYRLEVIPAVGSD